MNLIDRTASSNLPAIITGETGTGKEITARAIHDQSARRGPFVPVNCAAIAESLFESELFGREKGCFTGADRRRQRHIERANGGTLFLDEITEMRSDAQAKLLRVIEEKTGPPGWRYRRDSDRRTILAASNRPPERAIVERTPSGGSLLPSERTIDSAPTLLERSDDLPLLIDYFIAQANRDHHRRVQGMDDKCRQALAGCGKTYLPYETFFRVLR